MMICEPSQTKVLADQYREIIQNFVNSTQKRQESSDLALLSRIHASVLLQTELALKFARANWQLQKEPSDLYTYARMAARNHAQQDLEVIAQWCRANRYQDLRLAQCQGAAL